ncbi:hypothetical protein Dsin_003636 [Dipteronia sinensis]|uniref:Galactose oxidase-like Early set domain-containing protein n=1 Tax=Dipteronia sinensis TaxID=43782 RepID=A0AAE0B9H1_9ROSI|nr:hypothetical protein Dsin_003636 [Dipteronia sinensis]
MFTAAGTVALDKVSVTMVAPSFTTHSFAMNQRLLVLGSEQRDCRSIKSVLECYARASGQVVNFQKSAICVSRKVSRVRTVRLARIVGVQQVGFHERYLGLSCFTGKNKMALFASIGDRVWDWVKGWQYNLFLTGGKEVLLNAVIQ